MLSKSLFRLFFVERSRGIRVIKISVNQYLYGAGLSRRCHTRLPGGAPSRAIIVSLIFYFFSFTFFPLRSAWAGVCVQALYVHCIDLPLRPEGGKYLEEWIDDRDRRAGMGSGNTVGVGENKPGTEGGGTMWEVKGGERKGRAYHNRRVRGTVGVMESRRRGGRCCDMRFGGDVMTVLV